ncbi:MAG: glycosyltransferase [Thermoplasmata archaeon]
MDRFRSIAAPGYPEYRIALAPGPADLLRAPGFDVVPIPTPGPIGFVGLGAARRWDCPTLGTYRCDIEGMLGGVGTTALARAFFARWAQSARDHRHACELATAPSSSARAKLVGDGEGGFRRSPQVIPNGVDTRRFRPNGPGPKWHRRLGIGPERPLITYLGRLTADKGILRFLEVVEGSPTEPSAYAIGGGTSPARAVVERRFAPGGRLERRGRYFGEIADVQKPSLPAQSGLFVLLSLSDTSSMALLEAMACGTPCVVTDRGGPAELARRSGAAVIVDPTDPEGVRAAIQGLLQGTVRASALGDAGRGWVKREASIMESTARFEEAYSPLARPVPVPEGARRPAAMGEVRAADSGSAPRHRIRRFLESYMVKVR